jgi:glycosyltransferase involved in cell wall biosynthesis
MVRGFPYNERRHGPPDPISPWVRFSHAPPILNARPIVNVAILIGRFPPHDVGGAERQADRLAAALAARGHRVTVLTRRWPGRAARETRDGFTIVRTPIGLAGPARTAFDLVATLGALRALSPRPDAVLAFQTFASGWIAGFADVFLGLPSVVWVRGENEYRFDRHPHLFGPSIFAWRQARRNLVQATGHRHGMLAHIARRDPLRSERIAQRIEVLGNGVDLPASVVQGGEDVLYVGRLIAHKGVDHLVDALALLPAAARPTLMIAGDGPERAALEARAKNKGIDARFLGFVDRAGLAQLYPRARVIVLPSTEGEGLPNALLEAMAHGVPAVATALPGVDELVRDGGRVVPPGDPAALAAALTELADPVAHAQAARAARARAEVYSWDAITDRLESVLFEVARRAPRVWLVSPNPTSRGGVAAVARQIAVSSLTRKYRISMLPTYAPGSMLGRLYRGATGIIQIATVMLFKKPDLVHIKVASGGSFARKIVVGAICRLQGVPVLVHVHGGGFDQFILRSPGFVRSAANWLFEGTPQMLTVSDRWAARLQPLFPRARIEVLPNPIEVHRYDDLARARFARAVTGGAARDPSPMAIFLGDLLARKGAHDLVQSWPEVVRRFPGARLVLCGTGDTDGLRALARTLGVEAQVEVPGWVEFEAKRRLLAEATVFVLPSHIEGVPISLLEAMASGLPSVVTPVGGILDAVKDETEALVVPVSDPPAIARAVNRIFESPALARRMGEAARARVVEFDVSTFAAHLDRIYQRILGHATSQAGALEQSSREVA